MNDLFRSKKKELEDKYAVRIEGICEATKEAGNEVDLSVGFEMLKANVERGAAYPGGGECTNEEWAELINDFKDLASLARR